MFVNSSIFLICTPFSTKSKYDRVRILTKVDGISGSLISTETLQLRPTRFLAMLQFFDVIQLLSAHN